MIVDRARIATLLSGYELGAQVGAGAYGLVIRARHRQLDRAVAVKVLSVEGGRAVNEFAREARVLASMDHPHVVRVHDYVEDGDLQLIVMEFLAGGPLSRRKQMAGQQACAVGLTVATALSHAHGRGILHRDIKAGNVLFDGNGLVKVTDFGIAKVAEGAAGTASAVVGTPAYMAPEQILGGRLSPATDLYGLAALMYELLTGAPPFDPTLSQATLWQHHLNTLPAFPADVPAPLAELIMQNLGKDAASRHPDAHGFALDIAVAGVECYGIGWTFDTGVKLYLDDDVRDAIGSPNARTVSVRPDPDRPVHSAPAPTAFHAQRHALLLYVTLILLATAIVVLSTVVKILAVEQTDRHPPPSVIQSSTPAPTPSTPSTKTTSTPGSAPPTAHSG